MTPLQPVSTDVHCLSRKMTASRVKLTVHSASHSGPTPTKVCRKLGMRCPFIENPDGIWSKYKSPVPVDCWVFPVAVPNFTFGAARSMLTQGHLWKSICLWLQSRQ